MFSSLHIYTKNILFISQLFYYSFGAFFIPWMKKECIIFPVTFARANNTHPLLLTSLNGVNSVSYAILRTTPKSQCDYNFIYKSICLRFMVILSGVHWIHFFWGNAIFSFVVKDSWVLYFYEIISNSNIPSRLFILCFSYADMLLGYFICETLHTNLPSSFFHIEPLYIGNIMKINKTSWSTVYSYIFLLTSHCVGRK